MEVDFFSLFAKHIKMAGCFYYGNDNVLEGATWCVKLRYTAELLSELMLQNTDQQFLMSEKWEFARNWELFFNKNAFFLLATEYDE